jgi:hypothetical protein
MNLLTRSSENASLQTGRAPANTNIFGHPSLIVEQDTNCTCSVGSDDRPGMSLMSPKAT